MVPFQSKSCNKTSSCCHCLSAPSLYEVVVAADLCAGSGSITTTNITVCAVIGQNSAALIVPAPPLFLPENADRCTLVNEMASFVGIDVFVTH